jgi:dynein heavy chain 2
VEFEEDPDSKVLELKLKALILETLHYIDIVRALIEGRVRALGHWLWQKQLR